MEINGTTITEAEIGYTTAVLQSIFIEYGKSIGETEEESAARLQDIITYASWAFRRRIRRKLNNGTPPDDLTKTELNFVEALQNTDEDWRHDTSRDSAVIPYVMSEEELLELEESSIKAYELVFDLMRQMGENGDL